MNTIEKTITIMNLLDWRILRDPHSKTATIVDGSGDVICDIDGEGAFDLYAEKNLHVFWRVLLVANSMVIDWGTLYTLFDEMVSCVYAKYEDIVNIFTLQPSIAVEVMLDAFMSQYDMVDNGEG